MKTLVKGVNKKIFIETKYLNITDMKVNVFNLDDNSKLISDLLLEEISGTGTYFFDLKIDVNGYYLIEISSETISSINKLRKVIRVINNDLLEEVVKSRKMQTNKAVISEDNKTVNIFDDDGITIIHSFDISEDKFTRTPK